MQNRCFFLTITFLWFGVDLITSPRSTLIRFQRSGKVCVGSLHTMINWEYKLRNHSVELKFSAALRGYCGGLKKREKRETMHDAIVSVIDRSCLRN